MTLLHIIETEGMEERKCHCHDKRYGISAQNAVVQTLSMIMILVRLFAATAGLSYTGK
jgi:hypothetical protein